MARPKVDQDAIKDQILEIANTLLVESNGQRLSLSDIAKHMSVSQPYIFRYFKNKKELIGALATRWFQSVEHSGERVCNSDLDWDDKLRAYTIETLRIKKTAFEKNPKLFAAHLSLASQHKSVVKDHTQLLNNQIAGILAEKNNKSPSDEILNLVLDATVQFRSPYAILSNPEYATEERANKVLDALTHYLNHNEKI